MSSTKRVFLFTIIGALLLSLSAKLLADQFLTDRVGIIGLMVGLVPSLNPGIAFGLSLGGWEMLVIPCALIVLLWVAMKSIHTTLSAVGFGLIIGGALGNIIDRLRDGLVTDFFQVGTFPIFNVADSCITVGVVILLVEMVVQKSIQNRRKFQGPRAKYQENSNPSNLQ